MNYSDSERVAAVLENVGYRSTPTYEKADFIVFNTCSIRQKAEDRVYGLMNEMQELKKKNKRLVISITGCMVRKTSTRLSPQKDKLIRRLDPIDFVFRIDDAARIPDLIKEINGGQFATKRVHRATEPDEIIASPYYLQQNSEHGEREGEAPIPPQSGGIGGGDASPYIEGSIGNYFKINPKYTSRFQAFVPIMSGCDKFCAFCIVPYTRGRERSRSVAEIYEECKKLVENGCKEITLLGQNVNSFGLNARENMEGFVQHINGTTGMQSKTPFTRLLEKIDSLKEYGLKRVRWTSPHPRDMTDDVLDAVRDLETQMPYIHMPIQAGSDAELHRMNRPYTVDHYRSIVSKIRERMADCAVSTDIIVGFCGQTEEEFEALYALTAEIRWDMMYLSRYSMRPHTLAKRTMEDDVPKRVKAVRWHTMNDMLTKLSREKHEYFIGKTVEILVERRLKNGMLEGRSEHFKRTQFPGSADLIGEMVPVKITAAEDWSMSGARV